MSSYAHSDLSFSSAPRSPSRARPSFDSTKGLAAMLLAAIVAALLVVANQVIDSWSDGHLLAAWVALWAVGFIALALCAGAARGLARRLVAALDAWSHRIAQERATDRLWDTACADPRVMADLQSAISRSEGDGEPSATLSHAALRKRMLANGQARPAYGI